MQLRYHAVHSEDLTEITAAYPVAYLLLITLVVQLDQ